MIAEAIRATMPVALRKIGRLMPTALRPGPERARSAMSALAKR